MRVRPTTRLLAQFLFVFIVFACDKNEPAPDDDGKTITSFGLGENLQISNLTNTTANVSAAFTINSSAGLCGRIGVCYSSTIALPEANENSGMVALEYNGGDTTLTFQKKLHGLSKNTTYHARTFAASSDCNGNLTGDITYGDVVNFQTADAIDKFEIQTVGMDSASSRYGYVRATFRIVSVDYVCVYWGVGYAVPPYEPQGPGDIFNSATMSQITGPIDTTFTASIKFNVAPGTIYNVRPYVVAFKTCFQEPSQWVYGNTIQMQSKLTIAEITTLPVTDLTSYGATAAMQVASAQWEGQLGFCWSSTNPEPTLDDQKQLESTYQLEHPLSYKFHIGFLPNRPCYLRGVSIIGSKAYYGNVIVLNPPATTGFSQGTLVDDRNGVGYRTITVKDQTLMIDNFTLNGAKTFDWNEAQSLAPPGWHVPSAAEIMKLAETIPAPGGFMSTDLVNVRTHLDRFWSSDMFMTSEDDNRGWGFTDMLQLSAHCFPASAPKTAKYQVRYFKD